LAGAHFQQDPADERCRNIIEGCCAREELFSDDEALAPTEHEKILVVSNSIKPSPGQWKADVEGLLSLARAGETEKARERLQAIVDPLKN